MSTSTVNSYPDSATVTAADGTRVTFTVAPSGVLLTVRGVSGVATVELTASSASTLAQVLAGVPADSTPPAPPMPRRSTT